MFFHGLRFTASMASLVFLGSCSFLPRNSARLDNSPGSRPSIYDAWDARYKYDSSSRKMVPVYNGKVVGKTWSRDPKGQLNYSVYTGRTEEIDEDLFPLHVSKLDRQRDKNWEVAKKERMDDVSTLLTNLEKEGSEPLVEVFLEEEEDDFVPPLFVPTGIEFEQASEESPSVSPRDDSQDAQGGELSPFLPLP